MHGLLGKSSQDLFLERELAWLFLAFFDALDVGRDQVVEGVDTLVDLSKGIVIDNGKLSQPEHNSKENGTLFLRDEIIPTIHRFSSTIEIQIHAFR